MAVAVEVIRSVGASMPVGRGAAPLAVLLVIDVFMKPIGAVCAPVAVARAVAVSAFRAHGWSPLCLLCCFVFPRTGTRRAGKGSGVLPFGKGLNEAERRRRGILGIAHAGDRFVHVEVFDSCSVHSGRQGARAKRKKTLSSRFP